MYSTQLHSGLATTLYMGSYAIIDIYVMNFWIPKPIYLLAFMLTSTACDNNKKTPDFGSDKPVDPPFSGTISLDPDQPLRCTRLSNQNLLINR